MSPSQALLVKWVIFVSLVSCEPVHYVPFPGTAGKVGNFCVINTKFKNIFFAIQHTFDVSWRFEDLNLPVASVNTRDNMSNWVAETSSPDANVNDVTKNTPNTTGVEAHEVSSEGRDSFSAPASFGHGDSTGDVNMEAAITSDDVIRAGGFGARDDIGNFLPVAIDSTDFEASLRDARDYEEPQGEINRPGLGWTEAMKQEEHGQNDTPGIGLANATKSEER